MDIDNTCHATKFTFNSDGKGYISLIEEDNAVVDYTIDSYNQMTISFGVEEIISYELISILTDRIELARTDTSASISSFISYADAISYVDNIVQNPTCGDDLPQ